MSFGATVTSPSPGSVILRSSSGLDELLLLLPTLLLPLSSSLPVLPFFFLLLLLLLPCSIMVMDSLRSLAACLKAAAAFSASRHGWREVMTRQGLGGEWGSSWNG